MYTPLRDIESGGARALTIVPVNPNHPHPVVTYFFFSISFVLSSATRSSDVITPRETKRA